METTSIINPQLQGAIGDLIVSAIGICSVLITSYLVPYLKSKKQYTELQQKLEDSKLTDALFNQLKGLIKSMILIVENEIKHTVDGKNKEDKVINLIRQYGGDFVERYSDDELRGIIKRVYDELLFTQSHTSRFVTSKIGHYHDEPVSTVVTNVSTPSAVSWAIGEGPDNRA